VAGSVVCASVSLPLSGKGAPTCPVASPFDGEPGSCYWSPPHLRFHSVRAEHLWRALLESICRNVRCLSRSTPRRAFADAFAIDLPSNATGDAERLATHMLMGQARWVGWLVALRDTLVAGFGLKTSPELRDDVATDRIDFFRSTIGVVMRLFLARTIAISTSVCPFWLKSPLCADDLSPQRS